jgi:NAD(P)-dependent dehydrogenase (short-subunit alcohol dehydrogenase family)
VGVCDTPLQAIIKMTIQNKTFLITGGASGLGFATAKMIVDNGGNAVILDVNVETGEKAETSLGEKVKFVKTDVANEEQVQDAIDVAINHFGEIHGVANCAGVGPAMRVVGKNGPHSLDFLSIPLQLLPMMGKLGKQLIRHRKVEL